MSELTDQIETLEGIVRDLKARPPWVQTPTGFVCDFCGTWQASLPTDHGDHADDDCIWLRAWLVSR